MRTQLSETCSRLKVDCEKALMGLKVSKEWVEWQVIQYKEEKVSYGGIYRVKEVGDGS